MKVLALSLLSLPFTYAKVVSLNTENYHSLTEGKTVFIKFFAPWVSARISLLPFLVSK
jgi:hypothetical protein